ncbi:unnamed protein product [Blepharisma stoltei]|uniref:Ciliary microtubule inner protein 2A-C-like domain-containing protein n=1 Tax=Blepharisma stoltei TaxID=1481888 RepID=A0AAU9JGN7_9CILI|nr:unnamed protein product [Blepharisma stoltei]
MTTNFKHLPGYTGHIPSGLDEEEGIGRNANQSHIPGYQGYIPSTKSENLFGETYGKITHKSLAGEFPKGLDTDPKDKYKSAYREQFINLSTVKEKTATEILGVQPKKGKDPIVIPIETQYKFWAIEDEDREFKAATNAFFGDSKVNFQDNNKGDDLQTTAEIFFGREQQEEPIKHGEPIPGYTGVSRRVAADNIFGLTYAQSRASAHDGLSELKQEQKEILNQRANFVPDYRK